jgi:tripartite-type tricarboxylate transporter receptor subunit TctC
MSNWYALFAPRGVPEAILTRLESELPAVRSDPTLVQRSSTAGITMLITQPAVLRAKMEAEIPRWKQLVPQLGLKTQ